MLTILVGISLLLRLYEQWSKYDHSYVGGGTSTKYEDNKKDDKKKKKDSYAAQSKSAPGSVDPYASFDCKENKNQFKGTMCDVVLVSVNNKHCPTAKPNALAKGSFSDWQWDKTTGVTKPIDFRIECCGAEGCAPYAMTPVGTYVVQQLPDQGKNKIVPGLAVFGPVADDKDPIADGEKTVIIRMGGGLK